MRKAALVQIIVGVVCIAVEPVLTGILWKLGIVVSGADYGWWTGVSINIAGKVTTVGLVLVALGVGLLILAHFIAAPPSTSDDEQPDTSPVD